ncbi:MAG: hypothetical protein J7603_06270, partial [Pseudacidovorax sp.]|nr:hypothetical protein [Pseudacidovorax sp.]
MAGSIVGPQGGGQPQAIAGLLHEQDDVTPTHPKAAGTQAFGPAGQETGRHGGPGAQSTQRHGEGFAGLSQCGLGPIEGKDEVGSGAIGSAGHRREVRRGVWQRQQCARGADLQQGRAWLRSGLARRGRRHDRSEEADAVDRD